MVRNGSAQAQQRGLNLCREYIDAADDLHVVGTSCKLGDPWCLSSALAGLIGDAGQILGPIPQQGHGFLGQRGKYKLSGLPVGTRRMGRRVEHLRIEIVMMDMKPLVVDAVLRHARPENFAQTVDIEAVDM